MHDAVALAVVDAPSNGVIRTGNGLMIAGSRISLCDVMDYVHEGWRAERIAEWFHLSPEQIQAAMAHIEAHREEVEAEYRQALQEAREEREYWEARNRELLDRIRRATVPPEKAAIVARIREARERLGE